MNPKTTVSKALISLAWIVTVPCLAAAGDGVTFNDVAALPGSALATYHRTESATADSRQHPRSCRRRPMPMSDDSYPP